MKRFTRDAGRIFRLVATDTGRPLADIKSTLVGEDIIADAQDVLDSMIPRQKEVQTTDKLWYLARLTPYRTLDNVIDGVVITFTDITSLKSLESESPQYPRACGERVQRNPGAARRSRCGI